MGSSSQLRLEKALSYPLEESDLQFLITMKQQEERKIKVLNFGLPMIIEKLLHSQVKNKELLTGVNLLSEFGEKAFAFLLSSNRYRFIQDFKDPPRDNLVLDPLLK